METRWDIKLSCSLLQISNDCEVGNHHVWWAVLCQEQTVSGIAEIARLAAKAVVVVIVTILPNDRFAWQINNAKYLQNAASRDRLFICANIENIVWLVDI